MPPPAFLSYKSITSLVMSIVSDAYITGVCGLLTSITNEYAFSFAYLLITAINLAPKSFSNLSCSPWNSACASSSER